ncbi:MAG: DUF1501 domain-containing protein [Myxococcaceae bacterium]|nr:DUF1501 domain-containing protein [Myxococcaceae bacterium]
MRDPQGFSRRHLLRAASGFAGGALLGGLPFRTFAQQAALAPADRCFVFVYFAGGWDMLLSLDPRDPAVFTPERVAETRILPGYSLLATDPSFPTTVVTPNQRPGGPVPAIQFGPAIGRMADHYDQMCVVRGINMNTVAHEVGYRYFLTGKEPNGSAARGSSTATEIVGQMHPAVPVPSIAYGIETYNDRYPGAANALRVSRAADLLLTLSPSPTPLDSEIEKQLVDLRGKTVTCEAQAYDSRGLVGQYRDARSQMTQVLGNQLHKSFSLDFNAMDPQALNDERAAIRSQYNLPATGSVNMDSAAGRAAMIGIALKKGISQCVSMNLVGGLDTHFGTQVSHATTQRTGWNALADLVDDLRKSAHPGGGTFIDHTTIMVFSEFARTPLINGTGGRDHHICSAAALIGAGLKHNLAFGAAGDINMAAGLVDRTTGRPDPKGLQILPEDLIATVLASAKLDYAITRTEPLKAILSG